MQDQTVATAAAHLSQEASIPILNIDGLREALAGGKLDPGEASAEQIGEQLNMFKSIYRLLLLDKTETFERVPVTFSGLHEIMDRVHRRLSAAAGIPATRFLGQSPVGLNATGESDMTNYAMHVSAMQTDKLTDPLRRLDMVLARDGGLSEPPEYSWIPLTNMSDGDVAEAALKRAEALKVAADAGWIDEDEGRAALDGTPIFGALPGAAPGLPEPELPGAAAGRSAEQRLGSRGLRFGGRLAVAGVPVLEVSRRQFLGRMGTGSDHRCRRRSPGRGRPPRARLGFVSGVPLVWTP